MVMNLEQSHLGLSFQTLPIIGEKKRLQWLQSISIFYRILRDGSHFIVFFHRVVKEMLKRTWPREMTSQLENWILKQVRRPSVIQNPE